jgi:hypothetical protein
LIDPDVEIAVNSAIAKTTVREWNCDDITKLILGSIHVKALLKLAQEARL